MAVALLQCAHLGKLGVGDLCDMALEQVAGGVVVGSQCGLGLDAHANSIMYSTKGDEVGVHGTQLVCSVGSRSKGWVHALVCRATLHFCSGQDL